jgi:hypothetical protein
MYDWFRHRAPLAKVGHAMFLYDIAERHEDPRWVAQCTVPVAPLTPEAMIEGFGINGLRKVYFDCEQSWIFPGGGTSIGWYTRAIPSIDELRWPTDDERLEWLPTWAELLPNSALHLNYVQPTPGELPPFATWAWEGTTVAPQSTINEGEVEFNGMLVFVGYQVPQAAQAGTDFDVVTYWRVLERPSGPLSLMLHLVGEDGVPIAVGDGLGVPVDQWQPGDIIVQRHRLSVPEETLLDDYRLQVGVYWLDNMERWQATGGRDTILLQMREMP